MERYAAKIRGTLSCLDRIRDFRKEDRIAEIFHAHGNHPGLAHIFGAMEGCGYFKTCTSRKTGHVVPIKWRPSETARSYRCLAAPWRCMRESRPVFAPVRHETRSALSWRRRFAGPLHEEWSLDGRSNVISGALNDDLRHCILFSPSAPRRCWRSSPSSCSARASRS